MSTKCTRTIALTLLLALTLALLPTSLTASAATIQINGNPVDAGSGEWPTIAPTLVNSEVYGDVLTITGTDRLSIDWPVDWFDNDNHGAIIVIGDFRFNLQRDVFGENKPTSFNIKMEAGETLTLTFTANGSTDWTSLVPLQLWAKRDTNGVTDFSRHVMTRNGSVLPLTSFDDYVGLDTVCYELMVPYFCGGTYGVQITPPVDFIDVAKRNWAHPAIQGLQARGIVGGVAVDKVGPDRYFQFGPDRCVTRAEFITMLMRMLTLEADTTNVTPFADATDSDKFYYQHLMTAKALGIATGYKGNFSPNASITRQDMMTLLARAAEVKGVLFDGFQRDITFSDWDSVADYAKAPLQSLINARVVNGSNGKLKPLDNALRDEAAQLLYNAIDTSCFSPF